MSSQEKLTMAKILKQPNQDLATSYDLVIADLFKNLKSFKEGKIKLGKLGTFKKKHRRIKSALNGKTYAYYQVSFQSSATLKKELDK